MRLLRCVFLALAVSCSVPAQTYTISTIAGGGLPVNIPGTSAFLRNARAVVVDGVGNVFLTTENVVLRLDAITGILSLVAGNGTAGFSGDSGPATSAQLSNPKGVAVDSAGNLYIAGNNRIRKVSGGVITTVAGNGTAGFSGDNGPATSAQLNSPAGVAVDTADNLYIVDEFNSRVRKVSGGVITTVAGNGGNGFSGDNGSATSAQLGYPLGVAVDSAGNLYIAEFDNSGNNRIRKVSGGVITTVAGNGTGGFSGDGGPATSAQLGGPSGVAVDSAGNLYIADTGNYRIRKVSGGVITTVAGHGGLVFLGENGPATGALVSPAGVAVDLTGNLYIADDYYNRIRKVSGGVITTMAGGGSSLGDNGPATSTQLSPNGVAVDSSGNLYIADSNDHRIRKVSGGVITTVAGNGTAGFGGDNGSATSAQLGGGGLAVDSAGNLYIADGGNKRIRKVSGGVITTVAGNGTAGFSGDNGPAISAQLYVPLGVAVDSAGNLYIAEVYRIRKVSGGVITTVAGNGTAGFSGDNGPATSAQLIAWDVAVDSTGNLYIAYYSDNHIRKVSGGVITTVAGNGTAGFGGDNGPATSAQLSQPSGVAVDSAGNVYVADFGNGRVRLLQPQPPSIAAVTNAASNLSSASISPGEIITLYGTSLGPSQLMQAGGGVFATQLAGASVTINGVPAPIIYTSASQTAVIVPYATTGATAQITLAHLGKTATFQVPVASSAPGIFTYDSSGKGPAAALNQDGVTVNTAANRAQVGDVISLFATGEGQTSPAGVDGKLAGGSLAKTGSAGHSRHRRTEC